MKKEILDSINKARISNELIIGGEKITAEIWTEIIKLKNLIILNLQNNKIKEIPADFSTLENLEYINFDNNQIIDLPKNISKFNKIRTLSFRNNKIKEFPTELAKINSENFSKFRVNGNPIDAMEFSYSIRKGRFNQNSLYDILYSNPNVTVGTMFFSVKNLDNQAIAEFQTDNRFLNIYIYVFGKKSQRKDFLSHIRGNIDNELKNQKNEFVISSQNIMAENYAVRQFYYPHNKTKKIFIDYNKLLKFKKLDINLYFDVEENIKIPVLTLINYIGINEYDKKFEDKLEIFGFMKSVDIENFKLFKNITFNLSENFNIIIGRNATGKTSILQAITLGLLPTINNDKSNNFKSYVKFNSKYSRILTQWDDGSKSEENELGIYDDELSRVIFIFENTLESERYLGYPQQLLLSYGTNLNTNEKLDHTGIIDLIISGNADSYSTKSIFSDYSDYFYDPLILLEKLEIENNKKKNKNIAESIKLIKNTLNKYLELIEQEERIVLIQNFLNFYFLDINNNNLKTKNLSEGYKDHILLITDIIIRIIASRNKISDKKQPVNDNTLKNTKGVILIDEFDRHLHPAWQRKLLFQLKKDFPKIQFILTTHNLFSLQSAEGSLALILEAKNKQITVTHKKIEEGLSIESIYNMYFDGKNQNYSYAIEELFSKFYKLLTKVKLSKATDKEINEFRKIANELYTKDEEVQIVISRELRQMEQQTGKTF